MTAIRKQVAVAEGEVLCEALFNAVDALGLTQAELGSAIGLERTSVARIKTKHFLDPDSKQGELAILIIRIFRSLYALMGGDPKNMKLWMSTNNTHLNGIPGELITHVQGIVSVTSYLDAMRGKV